MTELLRENLLESSIGSEKTVAHQQRLLTVADHLAVESPIVVRLRLLRVAGPGRANDD
jgi:hypothetical protein